MNYLKRWGIDVSRVIDVFPFFNEVNLLELRLETLDPYVDFFVITEATTTFSGLPKSSYYLENKAKFKKFERKIIHQIVDNVPASLNDFEKDWFQRDAAKDLIKENFESHDFVIYGDVDEIPSPYALSKLEYSSFLKTPIMHCAQNLYYYYLNLQDISGKLLSYCGEYPRIWNKKWLGTVFTTLNHIESGSMTSLRDPQQKKQGIRIKNGGWHFSYCGSPHPLSVEDRIRTKIISAAHQEYNNDKILGAISMNVAANADIFGRVSKKFKVVDDYDDLPAYVRLNPDKFADILLR